MIEFVFAACLVSVPSDCREERLLLVDVPISACMMSARAQLALRTRDHPDQTVRRRRCGVHDPSWAVL
jgi:hypothetical protein